MKKVMKFMGAALLSVVVLVAIVGLASMGGIVLE